jgi:hypothetical protein
VLSQAVAPQVASVVLQAAVQQLPVPLMPQTIDMHEALEVHGAPSARDAEHVPPLQVNPVTQSVFEPQVVRHPSPALLHWRLLAHAVGVPALHVPAPSQLLWVSIAEVQTAVPQAVLVPGYVQVPLVSQPVAAQVASLIEHSELQQLPVPAMPHWSEAHCEFDEHGEPAGRPLVPPVVVVVAPVVAPVLLPVVVVAIVPVVPPVVVPPSVEGDELQAVRTPPKPSTTNDAASARM